MVVSISQADGDALQALIGDGIVATINVIAGDYDLKSGTSMASPHVAGVAALLRAAYPSATVAEIRSVMESTALDLGLPGLDDVFGHGLVNAQASLSALAAILVPCLGDANGDGIVNFADITAILGNWLVDYTPGTGLGDANGDGIVNFADITSVLGNWLTTCP